MKKKSREGGLQVRERGGGVREKRAYSTSSSTSFRPPPSLESPGLKSSFPFLYYVPRTSD